MDDLDRELAELDLDKELAELDAAPQAQAPTAKATTSPQKLTRTQELEKLIADAKEAQKPRRLGLRETAERSLLGGWPLGERMAAFFRINPEAVKGLSGAPSDFEIDTTPLAQEAESAYLGKLRSLRERGEVQNPKVGAIAGMLPTMAVPIAGAEQVAAKGAEKAAETVAKPFLKRALQYGGEAAARVGKGTVKMLPITEAQAVGTALDRDQPLSDALLAGALFAPLGPVAGEVAAPLVKVGTKVGDVTQRALERISNQRAVKAGQVQSTVAKIEEKFPRANAIEETGAALRREGYADVLQTPTGRAKQATTGMHEAGTELNAIESQLKNAEKTTGGLFDLEDFQRSQAQKRADITNIGTQPGEAGYQVRSKVKDEMLKLFDERAQMVDDIVRGNLGLTPEQPLPKKIPIGLARAIRTGSVDYDLYNKAAGGNLAVPIVSPAEKVVLWDLRNSLSDGLEKGIRNAGDENLIHKYLAANEKYAMSSAARDLADKEGARLLGNNVFGITDYILMAGGQPGLALARTGARLFGDRIASKVAGGAAKGIRKATGIPEPANLQKGYYPKIDRLESVSLPQDLAAANLAPETPPAQKSFSEIEQFLSEEPTAKRPPKDLAAARLEPELATEPTMVGRSRGTVSTEEAAREAGDVRFRQIKEKLLQGQPLTAEEANLIAKYAINPANKPYGSK